MSGGNFKLVIEAPLPDLYDLARGIAGTPEPVLGFPVPDGDQQIRDDLEALKANHSREIAGFESLCEVLKRERDDLAVARSNLLQRMEELSASESAASATAAERLASIEDLKKQLERVQIAEGETSAFLAQARDKIKALTEEIGAARAEIDALKKQLATERDLVSFKAEMLAEPPPPALSQEPAGTDPLPSAIGPADQVQPPELPTPVNLDAKRLEVLYFIWANKPTRDQFARRFRLASRSQEDNLLHKVRKAVAGKYRIETVDGIITAAVIEAAAAPPPKRESAVSSQPLPNPARAKPATGNLIRVSLPLLTATTEKGHAKITSSLFGRVLQHMADGRLYGVDKLKQVGGYANEEAVNTAFVTHKPMLARLGLEIERQSGIGVRLRVL